MKEVGVGLVGLGSVGSGALAILTRNREEIEKKLGFGLRAAAVCSRSVRQKALPEGLDGDVLVTDDWREVVASPNVDMVAELIGGTGVAREVVECAIAARKSVITANKELAALAGVELWAAARQAGVSLALEASVCGGIPIHSVLREGIAADQVQALFGILNGTSNYILTEVEQRGTPFAAVLKAAQDLGYAEADPTADIEGYDARSKLALLVSLALGIRVSPAAIGTMGISRIGPEDFHYAHQLGCTIRLLCTARRTSDGVFLSVGPALIPRSNILASVQGAYNAVLVKGEYGSDTLYYGRGAGSMPTGVAVVSDLMRVAREIAAQRTGAASPFAFCGLQETTPAPAGLRRQPWYLRFRVTDQPGIIAALAGILAGCDISIDAILQLPAHEKTNLPFAITLETSTGAQVRKALEQMAGQPFLVEAPLALPMETT